MSPKFLSSYPSFCVLHANESAALFFVTDDDGWRGSLWFFIMALITAEISIIAPGLVPFISNRR